MSQPLFDEIIPVSDAEVSAWLDTVPNLSALPSRREAYRKAYKIDDKIRAYKREGFQKELAEKLCIALGK